MSFILGAALSAPSAADEIVLPGPVLQDGPVVRGLYRLEKPGSGNGSLHLAPQIGLLALISANLYVIFFNLSWGPVMWVMLGEMFPNQIRGSGLAVSGAAQS